MAWTKTKTVIVAGVVAILAVGTTTIVIHLYRNAPFAWTKELSSDEDAQYARWTGTTPEQVAKNILESCSSENWAEVDKFLIPRSHLSSERKNVLGGLQIITLGKPFLAGLTMWGGKEAHCVFVPYAIRLKSGKVIKWQMAIKYDNSGKQWYCDGGFFNLKI